ncbi:MAG: hypothetical protein C0399_04235 [Syntrophus sp. (in: bacteria)]|nr:hypothetical protein [Syntrophus sp. (in: bacteria)]
MANNKPIDQVFLEQFDSKISTEIIEFGKRLSATKADVYILMARKAACLISCLDELRLVSLDGYVTTDRTLDMDAQWLRGKDVVIVDDAIVSGTTLYRTINRLKENGVKKIRAYVLCVNKDWFKAELLEDDAGKSYLVPPYTIMDNAECIRACSDIVNALSVLPRPYDVDFPYFKGIQLLDRDFSEIISFSDWESDEVTSTLQDNNDVFTLTLTPNKAARVAFDNEIGTNISDFSILKVRIYGRKFVKSKVIFSIKIVPMIILNPLFTKTTDRLFSKIAETLQFNIQEIREAFISSTSKLRLIQYALSTHLARFWVQSISSLSKNEIELNHDIKAMNYLFSESVIPALYNGIHSKAAILPGFVMEEKVRERVLDVKEGVLFTPSIAPRDLGSIEAALIEPFLDLYYGKELVARKLVLRFGKNVFKQPQYQQILDRLNEGYTPVFLKSLIEGCSDYNPLKIISLFLDKAIDAGIVVPIIVENKGVVYRAFRHGEDVQFGEKEERLCAVAIESFSKALSREELPHLWVEKLIVLLIKIGIQTKFLSPVLSNFPNEEGVKSKNAHIKSVASISSYLHGPIVIMHELQPGEKIPTKPWLDPNENSYWLTNVLLQKHILKYGKNRKNYALNKKPNVVLDRTIEGKADNIGTILGHLLKNAREGKRPQVVEQDLVKLTASIAPVETAQSLAAEINIFFRKWPYYRSMLNNGINRPSEYLMLSGYIRMGGVFFTAINSGLTKFFWFYDKAPQVLIRQVENEFENTIYRNLWNEFWPPTLDWDESAVDEDLMKTLKTQGLWLLSMNIYIRMLDVCLRHVASPLEADIQTKNEKIVQKRLGELEDLLAKINRFKDDKKTSEIIGLLENFIAECSLNNNAFFPPLLKIIITRIDNLHLRAKMLLDNVELMVNKFGKIEPIKRYAHSIFIDIDEMEYYQCSDIWYQVDNLINEFNSKIAQSNRTNDTADSLLRIPDERNPFERGMFIACASGRTNNWLISFAVRLLSELSGKINIRIVILSQLSEDYRIKVAGKNNTNIKFGYFWNRVEQLENIYLNGGRFSRSEIITILEDKEKLMDEFKKLPRKIQSLLGLKDEESIDTERPFGSTFRVKRYELDSGNKDEPLVDVGIITVVTPETRAVLKQLGVEPENDVVRKGRSFYSGTIETSTGEKLGVVLTQQLQMGNRSAVIAYQAMVKEYNPKILILLGIAGSIATENNLCDVVIADQIIYYENKKETLDKTYRRGESFKIPAKLLPLINKFFIKFNEPAILNASEGSYREKFAVHKAPIGSGESVIANSASEVTKWLKEFNSKVMAIEMEAGGFLQAYYEDDLEETARQIGVLVIRGISDHADHEKDDKWRAPASENAVEVALQLLRFVSLS